MRSVDTITRMTRSRWPPKRTSPTPLMVSNFFLITLAAYKLSCCMVRSPVRAIHIIGRASASTFLMIGGSVSVGNLRCTWLILACTSLKATSIFLSRLKTTLTLEAPGEELDWMWSIPGVVLTADSMTLVTLVSMTSELAPRKVVVMLMTGKSTDGMRSTPMRS